MNEKKIIDNYNYGLIAYIKYNNYDNLSLVIENEYKEISLPVIILLSLYAIEFNNIESVEYDERELKKINKILSLAEEDVNNVINIKGEELKEILNSCKSKRVDSNLNKKICLLLANHNNSIYKNDITRFINIEKLENTLNNIK